MCNLCEIFGSLLWMTERLILVHILTSHHSCTAKQITNVWFEAMVCGCNSSYRKARIQGSFEAGALQCGTLHLNLIDDCTVCPDWSTWQRLALDPSVKISRHNSDSPGMVNEQNLLRPIFWFFIFLQFTCFYVKRIWDKNCRLTPSNCDSFTTLK